MKFLLSGDKRTALVKINILGSFVIKGLSVLISFLLIPLTIDYVSGSIYGIWLTIYSIIQWMGVMDIGLGNGLRNTLTQTVAKGDYAYARKLIGSTYICLLLIFIPVAIISIIIIPHIDWTTLLNTPSYLQSEIAKSMQIVVIFVSFAFVIRIQGTVLVAMQYNALSSMFYTLGDALVLIIIFFLKKYTTGNLIILACVLTLSPIFAYLIGSLWTYYYKFPSLKPDFKNFKFSIVKNLLNLGIKFFIIQISFVVLNCIINVLISHVSGPEDVTEYNVIYKYLTIPFTLFSIIVAPIWSAFTDAYAKDDFIWMNKTYRRMNKYMFVFIYILILLVLFNQIFFKIWLGDSVTIRLGMVIVVAINILEMIFYHLQCSIINGIGKIKLQLILSIFNTILSIPLALFLGNKYGAIGVVTSTCLLNILPMILLSIQVKKILHKHDNGIWSK